MRLVYKFYIRHTDELDRLFRISNNLYNQTLYLFRQRLDADGVWTWYNDMDKLIKGVTNLEGECNYKLLKSQCSQQSVCSDCVTYVKSRIKFNTFNTLIT